MPAVLKADQSPEPTWLDRAVAACPICGGRLQVDVQEIETDTRLPVSIDLECESAPDFDAPEWDEWFRWHYSTPYINWLPVTTRVLEWMRSQTPNAGLSGGEAVGLKP